MIAALLVLPSPAAAQDWTLSKTANPTTYTAAGQTITFTYVITNTRGDGTLTSLTDDKVTGIVCPTTAIPENTSLTCTGTYVTTAADVTAGSVTNTATASGDACNDGCLRSATTQATITFLAQPAWTLGKTATPTTYAGAGQVVGYSYVLRNTGNVAIASIVLGDNRIPSVSCPAASLAPGANMTCTGSYTTTAADVTAGSVTNTATATGIPAAGTLSAATAQATITFSAQPAWTLTNTASPTTYTGAGQAIGYSYVLTNTGNVGIGSVVLSDNIVAPASGRASSVSCPSASLAAGASMTCTGSYTTTAADVTAGSVTNTATATGVPAAGALQPVTAQSKVTAIKPAAGSITILKTAGGGDNTFSFTTTLPGVASFTLTTVGGSASRTFASIAPGTYAFTEVNLPREWRLASLACTGSTAGGSVTIDLAGRSAAIALAAGESVTCTFANVFDVGEHRTTTQHVISNFLKHRNELMATHEPDRSRFIRRMPGSLWGEAGRTQDAGAGAAVALSGSDGENATRLSFATSLSQIMRARANPAAVGDGETQQAMALGAGLKDGPRKAAASPGGLDIWVEGHFSDYRDRANGLRSSGHFGILYVGADYLVTPAILVGALVQLDWTGERAGPDSAVEGQGYMAGPYASIRLSPHLFLDARVAWGSSDNSVKPFGTYEDAFTTDRWLANARLTGNWRFGNFRVTPSLAYTFVEDRQHGYVDALGVLIPGQAVSLGRLAFGPELAYRLAYADGSVWEPLVSLQGVWDNSNTNGAVGGLAAGGDDFRAVVQAGVLARLRGGLSLRAVGSYDGLGSRTGFHDLGGQLWLNAPLN